MVAGAVERGGGAVSTGCGDGDEAGGPEWTERWCSSGQCCHGTESAGELTVVLWGVLVSHCQGRVDEARPLLERSQAILKSTVGPWDVRVGDGEHDLGEVCRRQVLLHLCCVGLCCDWFQGDLTEALSHYERALEIKRRSVGPDHPSVAKTLNNMGLAYEDMVCGVVAPLPH